VDVNLTITEKEFELLVRMLEAAWTEKRSEVHHAHFSPQFREGLKQEEDVLSNCWRR
jgi:hypothetical protein